MPSTLMSPNVSHWPTNKQTKQANWHDCNLLTIHTYTADKCVSAVKSLAKISCPLGKRAKTSQFELVAQIVKVASFPTRDWLANNNNSICLLLYVPFDLTPRFMEQVSYKLAWCPTSNANSTTNCIMCWETSKQDNTVIYLYLYLYLYVVWLDYYWLILLSKSFQLTSFIMMKFRVELGLFCFFHVICNQIHCCNYKFILLSLLLIIIKITIIYHWNHQRTKIELQFQQNTINHSLHNKLFKFKNEPLQNIGCWANGDLAIWRVQLNALACVIERFLQQQKRRANLNLFQCFVM